MAIITITGCIEAVDFEPFKSFIELLAGTTLSSALSHVSRGTMNDGTAERR